MSDIELKEIADKADLIVNGYAFTIYDEKIRVLNIDNPTKACVIFDGKIIETTMDDIEMDIVMDYYHRDREFLSSDDENA